MTTHAQSMPFNELLQQKIQTAIRLNEPLQQTPNEPLPASFFSNVLSMINPSSSLLSMHPSAAYADMMDTYKEQMNASDITSKATASNKSSRQKPTSFEQIVQDAARKYGVSEELIHAIIKTESNYNPKAKSHAGAMGLMQLMPGTARYLGVKDPYDAKQNIFGGTKYISDMLRQHNGDLTLALAAYNAGPGNVKKYGGVPPFKETQNYIQKINNLLA